MEAAAHKGMVYIRTTRPATPVIYGADEKFEIGGSKVIRDTPLAVATVVAAGITVFEALKASDELSAAGTPVRVIDAYSIEPIDVATLVDSARQTGNALITVEDHYVNGGLGDAVSAAVSALGIQVHRLAIKDIPRSGQPDELFDRYGISTTHIVATVRRLIDTSTA
jgi:transketolase